VSGPGRTGSWADPDYNRTAAEGAAQAPRALPDIANAAFDYKVMWMGIELPRHHPGTGQWLEQHVHPTSAPTCTAVPGSRAGPCAQFFGGQTSASPYALMWQRSGGGAANGIGGFNGDLDTIDAIRLL
jgi:hypothetical protein